MFKKTSPSSKYKTQKRKQAQRQRTTSKVQRQKQDCVRMCDSICDFLSRFSYLTLFSPLFCNTIFKYKMKRGKSNAKLFKKRKITPLVIENLSQAFCRRKSSIPLLTHRTGHLGHIGIPYAP